MNVGNRNYTFVFVMRRSTLIFYYRSRFLILQLQFSVGIVKTIDFNLMSEHIILCKIISRKIDSLESTAHIQSRIEYI